MPEIRVLDTHLINKIAAGEVVERPANAVKELCENAVDAGARNIAVEIRDGGKSLIRIADDGGGIPAGQVRTAFARHATSKIYDLDSLEGVMTLGFRGEALSSIAGVSMTMMQTKQRGAAAGVKIEIHGGEIISEDETGCADGTEIIVRDLFYNTPARRKFLKTGGQEAAAITELMFRLAFSRPDIAFSYINNGVLAFKTDGGGDIIKAAASIYEGETAGRLKPVSHTDGSCTVTGFCSLPELNRSNRQYCSFFINGRYVRSEMMQTAAEDSYRTRLPIGRFPVFALHLAIDPRQIDVNVHPAKLEVKFAEEGPIRELITTAVTKALSENERPQGFTTKPRTAAIFRSQEAMEYEPVQLTEFIAVSDVFPIQKKEDKEVKEDTQKKIEYQEAAPAQSTPLFNDCRIIGRFFGTYWLVEQGDSVYFIDQHAAHERVLFDEFSEKVTKAEILSQSLLAPAAITLSPTEYAVLMENMTALEAAGFEIEPFGGDTVAVRRVPYIINNPARPDYVHDIIRTLANAGGVDTANAVARAACAAAVKSGDSLNENEVRELIKRLLCLPNPFTCPHGRPVIVELTRRGVEKMFKRIQ